MTAPQIERRVTLSPVPIRSEGAATAASGRRLVGYAAVFNSRSANLGGFVEELAPNCFTKALRTSDVRALVDHNPSLIIGRLKAGTLRLREDNVGLRAEIDCPRSPTGDGVLESVGRGDLSQMSFSFTVVPGVGDRYSTGTDGMPIRRITEIDELLDVSVVSFPAYADTVVSVRALQLATETARVRPPRDSAIEAERRRLDAAEREGNEAMEAYETRDRLVRESRAREERRDRDLRILFAIADDDWQMREIARLALHEAAHSVMFYFDGAGVEACGLVLAENPARCTGGYARPRDGEMWTVQSILAGIAADRIGGYGKPQDVTNSDVIKAKRELPVGQRSHADVERQIGLASDSLRKYWPAVQALAREIRLKTDLDGAEAETIIARALGAYRAA